MLTLGKWSNYHTCKIYNTSYAILLVSQVKWFVSVLEIAQKTLLRRYA